ncbi:MAG: C4-dicarboxylate ABC transporter permease [Hyphomicrobiales bacterium]|nr:MAG: C4-dicarboxylate ABC transporter permease [Hyphomicrobiales bacterium]
MWFALLIVLIQFTIVLMRYVFGVGSIFMQESIVYLHGFLFMLAAAYTLSRDDHVRVDIFYRDAAPRKKAVVNLIGAVLLLLPVCIVLLWTSLPYVMASWATSEGSPETSGIQLRYLQKTAIPVFAVMMGLQGVAMIIRSLQALGGDEAELKNLQVESIPEQNDAKQASVGENKA